MKRLAFVALIVVFFLSSCAYNKQTLLDVDADEAKVGIGPGTMIEGKKISGRLYRQVSVAFPGDEAMKEFKDIKTTEGTGDDGLGGSLDITE